MSILYLLQYASVHPNIMANAMPAMPKKGANFGVNSESAMVVAPAGRCGNGKVGCGVSLGGVDAGSWRFVVLLDELDVHTHGRIGVWSVCSPLRRR